METGFYYLQSRYYDPEIGRFVNADVYADTGSGLLGTNVFAYCGNNAVNMSDPTGYWGKDVHWGNNGTASLYGTYRWARDCGLSVENAKIVANANNAQDDWDNHATLPWNRHKHFRAHGVYDYANIRFWNAVKLWKNGKKTDALKDLGRALHGVQDYYAHLDWHVGNDGARTKALYQKKGNPHKLTWIAAQGAHLSWDSSTGTKWSTSYFDDVNYDVWRAKNHYFYHKWVGRFNNPRYLLTQEVTKHWIKCFFKEIAK